MFALQVNEVNYNEAFGLKGEAYPQLRDDERQEARAPAPPAARASRTPPLQLKSPFRATATVRPT